LAAVMSAAYARQPADRIVAVRSDDKTAVTPRRLTEPKPIGMGGNPGIA